MEEVKKPSMVSPVLVTAALVSCLISLLLTIISGNYSFKGSHTVSGAYHRFGDDSRNHQLAGVL
ncbi:MAG: hypothetical protein ACYSTJ_10450 [Planctomycetota bacterium]|jgi:hypothetical protein